MCGDVTTLSPREIEKGEMSRRASESVKESEGKMSRMGSG